MDSGHSSGELWTEDRRAVMVPTPRYPYKAGRRRHGNAGTLIIEAMPRELENVALTAAGKPLEELPRYSGVYRFYDAGGALLYIGKSIDIRARISAHYQEGRKPGRHQRIMGQVEQIDCTATAGEVGALLMENAAIKAETPLYNRRQRRVKSCGPSTCPGPMTGFCNPWQPTS